jgi:hypothetical protein
MLREWVRAVGFFYVRGAILTIQRSLTDTQ